MLSAEEPTADAIVVALNEAVAEVLTHKKEAEMAVKTVQFPHVARLCYTLEQCFTHGLKPFLFGKPTYWNWVQHLDECIPDSDQIIRNIKQLARTSNGRARLFIVMGLNEGNLSELVNGLVWNDALCREHLTEQSPFWPHSPTCDQALNALVQIRQVRFHLDLRDSGLEMPNYWNAHKVNINKAEPARTPPPKQQSEGFLGLLYNLAGLSPSTEPERPRSTTSADRRPPADRRDQATMINPRRQSMSGARRGGVFREGSTYDLEMHNGNATTMMGLEGGDVPVIPIEQQIMQIISKNETDLKEKEEEEKQRKDGSLVRLEEEITRLRNEKEALRTQGQMLWNELEGAQQKIKDLQDEVNVYKAFFNDKDGQGEGDGEDDDVVPAAAEYTPIAVEEELARLEAAGTAASAAASVVLPPPMEDDQTEEERIRRLAAAEHEEELRKLADGKGKEESAKQREGDGRSAKAEEGTEDGESEPRDAFYLLHEKSKRFLQELKASDNHTLSLLSNFHL